MSGPSAVVRPLHRPLVSIVVPAYNESLVIEASLGEIYRYLTSLTDRYRFELLVVDDGSSDGTGVIVEEFARSHPGVRLLRHPVNFRLGQALRFAFGQSLGDFVVTFDADLTYSCDHIGRLLDAIVSQHARMALASPYMKGGTTTAIPRGRELMSKGVNKLLGSAAREGFSTVTGMVRAYDGPFIRSLDLKAMGPEINTEIVYKAQILRTRIIEVPAHLDWSAQDERMRVRQVSLKVSATSKLLMFASFLMRPLTFFVLPGLFLMFISIWTLGSVAFSVVRNLGSVGGHGIDGPLSAAFALTWKQRPHSFVVGGISLLIGVQLVSLGLLATQAKRYFEDLFHLGTAILRREERVQRLERSTKLGVGHRDSGGDRGLAS